MITVKINEFEMEVDEVHQSWLAEHLHSRQGERESVCLLVRVREPGVNVTLSSGGCTNSVGGGRLPNDKERAILQLWDDKHLDENVIQLGWLISFLKRLREML